MAKEKSENKMKESLLLNFLMPTKKKLFLTGGISFGIIISIIYGDFMADYCRIGPGDLKLHIERSILACNTLTEFLVVISGLILLFLGFLPISLTSLLLKNKMSYFFTHFHLVVYFVMSIFVYYFIVSFIILYHQILVRMKSKYLTNKKSKK